MLSLVNQKYQPFVKKDNQINEDDINPESTTVIHIFSNVLDLDDFDGNAVLLFF